MTDNEEALQQKLAGAMKLVELTCNLALHNELDDVLACVTRDVCSALNCERASLFRFTEDRQSLYSGVVTELEVPEIKIPIDQGITGWVARRQKIANIPDPVADARWDSSIDRLTGFQTRNILAAPVVSSHNDRILGVLQILNKCEGHFDEFDEQLLMGFASHAATALERAQLLADKRRSQELQIEIDMGRHIQTSFLPESLPQIAGYEVGSWWQPAEAVSGDYYDLVQLPDGRLGFVVADVSGHGVGPSLIMASARAMLHVLTRTSSDPEQILRLVSETISPDLRDGRFITFLMGALDPETHEVTYANAGHGPALRFSRQTQEFQTLESTGLPMGFGADIGMAVTERFAFEPGDLLLLATDGATELKDEHGEMFGIQRMCDVVQLHHQQPAGEIIGALRKAISSFQPDHPADDITLLLLERKM